MINMPLLFENELSTAEKDEFDSLTAYLGADESDMICFAAVQRAAQARLKSIVETAIARLHPADNLR